MTPEWLEDGRKVPDDVMYEPTFRTPLASY